MVIVVFISGLKQHIDVPYDHYQTADNHKHEQHDSKLTDSHARQKVFANDIADDCT